MKHTAYHMKHRRLRCAMYTETLFSDVKSRTQNTCGQIFMTNFHWTWFYSLRQKGDVHEALEKLIRDHGIPNHIIPDNSPELVAGEFKRKALKYGTTLKPIEAWMPNQNLAESAISVGSHQVSFLMCTLETLQKYCSTSSLLLTFC